MNKLLIYEYINRLRRDDIVKFCNIKGIKLQDDELDIIYNCIKNDYKRFFSNQMEVLSEIKTKISDNTFKEIMKLYDKYKDKIK